MHTHAGHVSISDLVLFTGAIGGIIVLIFVITVVIFAIAIVVLCKAKARLGKQLQNHHRKDIDAENKIYEEIDQTSQTKMDTETNIAYVSCHSIMKAASCAHHEAKN